MRLRNSQATAVKPLHLENRATLNTSEAAHHFNRTPQTLRQWAHKGNGPVQPLRVNGRLAWPVAEIRSLLGV